MGLRVARWPGSIHFALDPPPRQNCSFGEMASIFLGYFLSSSYLWKRGRFLILLVSAECPPRSALFTSGLHHPSHFICRQTCPLRPLLPLDMPPAFDQPPQEMPFPRAMGSTHFEHISPYSLLWTWFNRLVPNRKRSTSRLYVCCHPAYLTYMQSTSWETLGWRKHKLESRLPGEISITSDMQMTPSLWQKAIRRTKEPLDESERGEWKSWLKAQHSEN